MSIESILTFILASSLITIAPGPDNIFVLTQSALYGKKSGLLVTLGLCSGLIIHTTAVALGIAAIFQSSPLAFAILKYFGAFYLLYLAWQAFRASPNQLASPSNDSITYKALYVRGIIMNVTNPKVSIFFMAFLPQFTHPASCNLAIQLIVLGLVFICVALLIFSSIAFIAGYLSNWLVHSSKSHIWLNRIAATVFIGLGIKLLLSGA